MEIARPKWIPAAALLLTAMIACAGRAAAQEDPTEVKPGAFLAAGGMLSAYKLDYGEHRLGGYSAFLDMNLTTRYGIEGEARWLVFNQQANVNAKTFLIGPRILFNPRILRGVTPYVKLLVGDGKFNFPYNYATGSYFVMAPGAGADVPLGHTRFRIRLIDVE
ncbi:MAG TPA: outer membrane beta-barrel protein, partial [Acidobacteriaceae bacterium]|nr:outer membrane beta-barrel protein [Acidobacteriaceae bacterium]